MNFSVTSNQPISNDIKKRVEVVKESITNYQNLYESIFSDGVSTMVSLELGMPYYIQHASSGKILTTNEDNDIFLQDKPKKLTTFQEWTFEKADIDDSSNGDTPYRITSNYTNMCMSYDTSGNLLTSDYEIKLLECIDKKSLWRVENQNNAYKKIMINGSTKTMEYTIVDNVLKLSDTKTNYSNSILNAQSWIIKPNISSIVKMKNDISMEINEIKNLVKKILPSNVNYKSAIKSNAHRLLKTMDTLDQTIIDIEKKRKHIAENNPEYDEELLEGTYQNMTIDTNAKFYNYSIYLLVILVISIIMLYIYNNPYENGIDSIILFISILILMYYLYDYFNLKQKILKLI